MREKRSLPVTVGETAVYPFPPGSIFSIFFEVAIKLFDYSDEISQNILLDFPITYAIPYSDTGARSFSTSRSDVLHKLEEVAERFGLDGEACVLRLLCEIQSQPMGELGLLGDIIHLVFRGDLEEEETHSRVEDYRRAMQLGHKGDCWKLNTGCPVSLLNIPLFSP